MGRLRDDDDDNDDDDTVFVSAVPKCFELNFNFKELLGVFVIYPLGTMHPIYRTDVPLLPSVRFLYI